MVGAQGKSTAGHDSDPGTPPVTICCASSDARAVRDVSEALEARGYEVQLAEGVDEDTSALTAAIEAMSGHGLYVLCRSHALDRNAIDGLREILRDHDVPFGRTLTLAVDTQRPRDLEGRIVSVLRRMVTGRADGRAKAWGSSLPPSEDDPDTTVKQRALAKPAGLLDGLGTAPENANPDASTNRIEVPQADEPYSGADHTAVGPAPLPPSSSPGPAAAPLPPPSSPEPSLPPPSRPEPAAASLPPPHSPEPAVAPVASPPPVPPSQPVLTPTAGASAIDAPVFAPTGAAGSMSVGASASASLSTSGVDFQPPLTMGGRIGRVLGTPKGMAAVLGGVGLLLLVVILVAVSGDDEDDDAASDTVAKNEEPSKSTEDEKKGAAKEPEADAKTDDADSNTDAKEPPRAEPVAPPTAVAYVPGAPPPAIPERVTLSDDEDPPAVTRALLDREVRAIDLFLVSQTRPGTLIYDHAVDYCRELTVADLGDWRVPAIGELNAISKAGMLDKDVYWSATPADTFGDTMLVINAKKDRISVVSKGWDGAKIVCLRLRQP